jgi:hypothetical protein
METLDDIYRGGITTALLRGAPYFVGKLIEWKPPKACSIACLIWLTPYFVGKLIEWKQERSPHTSSPIFA